MKVECIVVSDTRFGSGGFTLIELMIGIAVAGVLLALAVPSFQNLTANNALRSASADLITAINTARAQAVNLRVDIVLEETGSSWTDGWRIKYGAGTTETDQTFTPSGGVTVTQSSGSGALTFTPSGMMSAGATFEICDDRTNEIGRQIKVGLFGTVENTAITCS
jgi:type IV fimbrial biogenesis protein FimT